MGVIQRIAREIAGIFLFGILGVCQCERIEGKQDAE